MTVPGSSVLLALRNSISVATSKHMSFVFQSCSAVSLSTVLMLSSLGLGIRHAL